MIPQTLHLINCLMELLLPEMCLLITVFSTDSKAAGFILTACRICVLLKYFPAVKICLCDTIVCVCILTFHNYMVSMHTNEILVILY